MKRLRFADVVIFYFFVILPMAVVLFMLSASPVIAKPRHWYKDWRFWVGEGVIATSLVLDGQSTCRNQAWGYPEHLWIARGSLSCSATIGRISGGFAFYSTLNAVENWGWDNDRNKVIRSLTPWMVPVPVAVIHLHAASYNYSFPKPK